MQEREDALAQVQLTYARARAEFDRSSAGGHDGGERTVSIRQYKDSVKQVTTELMALGKTGDWTAQESSRSRTCASASRVRGTPSRAV